MEWKKKLKKTLKLKSSRFTTEAAAASAAGELVISCWWKNWKIVIIKLIQLNMSHGLSGVFS